MSAGTAPLREEAEEARWVARARCGDEAGYRWLLERYRVRAVRLAAHVLRRESEAEDIAQEAFLRAFRQLASLKAGALFAPWLYSIVVRLCLDLMRRKRWTQESSIELLDGSVSSETSATIDTRLVVESVLDKLSPAMRAALVLRELEGMGYDEISEVLCIPVGTVRSRLNTARSQFRKLWEESHGNSQ
jgi:RNA polymerase sigma-70 factor (ECF subfamily)